MVAHLHMFHAVVDVSALTSCQCACAGICAWACAGMRVRVCRHLCVRGPKVSYARIKTVL